MADSFSSLININNNNTMMIYRGWYMRGMHILWSQVSIAYYYYYYHCFFLCLTWMRCDMAVLFFIFGLGMDKIGRYEIREFTKGILSSPVPSLKSTKVCTWYFRFFVCVCVSHTHRMGVCVWVCVWFFFGFGFWFFFCRIANWHDLCYVCERCGNFLIKLDFVHLQN